jgi:phosphoribosyl 1,2-cyclic phosphodiesterase
MIFCNLGSGSRGNSTYIQSGDTAILIDQGFSNKEVCRRMALLDLKPESIRAIVLTHDHSDHSRGIGVFARKHKIPVYITELTAKYLPETVLKNIVVKNFTSGDSLQIGDITLKTFHIPHDAVDPIGLIVSGNGKNLMHLTDIGKPIQSVIYQLQEYDFDLVFLESNHDPFMLKTGPYPLKVQMRIKSRDGHLSNDESLQLFRNISACSRLKHLVLGHLSAENNTHEIVTTLFNQYKTESKHSYSITIARQEDPTIIFKL